MGEADWFRHSWLLPRGKDANGAASTLRVSELCVRRTQSAQWPNLALLNELGAMNGVFRVALPTIFKRAVASKGTARSSHGPTAPSLATATPPGRERPRTEGAVGRGAQSVPTDQLEK